MSDCILIFIFLSNFINKDGESLSYDCPKVMTKLRRVEIFNGTCYVSKIQQAFTATTNGCILVWNDVPRKEKDAINANYKKKKHVNTINVQNYSITVIAHNENMLVTGNSNGCITFYNYQLKLLYWCQNHKIDSIQWISFDLQSNLRSPVFTTKISEKRNGKAEMVSLKFTSAKYIPQIYKAFHEAKSSYPPLDATLQGCLFNVRNFLACSSTGVIALIEIPKQKWHFILPHPVAATTSMDAHPESNYIVVGDVQGTVHLYNHEKHTLVISRSMPSFPDFWPILEKQTIDKNIIYITCPQNHESLKAVTALKFSPRCDMLVCGLENGAIWILHHITLNPLEDIPYKHSSAAVNKIAFAQCADYMAYADNALTVVVFKRNDITTSNESNVWNLIGKYHSHYLPIRDILFGPAISDSAASRFFSLGEDQELIEYDLEHSGPYPMPGLQILRIDKIEQSAIPLCLAWYPEFGVERFLMISNSEYKYKIFSDVTKTIRGTYLGPTFGEPVQQFQVLTKEFANHKSYMIFATEKEIGLQLLPFDGNPYKIVGMTGHPRKITNIAVSSNREILFTTGYNDPCVLMWKIKLKSVDLIAQLGGEGLSPFHCLIEGDDKLWLINDMQYLFYYVQLLHQNEYTTAARIISDSVAIEQIPNLMRAIGYFPTIKEIENIMTEVSYRHYIETDKLVEKITFEEFIRLYVNHRPAFGICMRQIKEAFRTFIDENSINMENPTLTREQFMDVLLGRAILKTSIEDIECVGEPLTMEEAYTYLKLLVPSEKEMIEIRPLSPQRDVSFNFLFLPPRISYKDFAMDIMGIETLEETKVDNQGNQHDDYP
ncbi:cilia- and flagella-associated protein 251-like isoform X1 [Cataglyphis hispanica]|uniref:cilia- and flagella-associated protein 251-like isoform X1 n=1 Tax=Cataglyphis hispanica TaxID=1086592 RepID=UPI00217FE4E7|nr:cilia- and flagella-associated protein 251-like isoform X1 [Cataglyphis hispanica]